MVFDLEDTLRWTDTVGGLVQISKRCHATISRHLSASMRNGEIEAALTVINGIAGGATAEVR